jgi:DNA-binding beta-propeller fold protein YncE
MMKAIRGGAAVFKKPAAAFLVTGAVLTPGQAVEPLRFEKALPLSGIEGRIDHMSADIKGGRLFVSALGNKSLEVLDWNTGKILRTVGGLDEPQGNLYVPANNRVYVATGGDGRVRIFDASTFNLVKSIELGEDADNVRFEAGRRLVWVGYGSGGLAALDLDGTRIADVRLSHHPESFQLERDGPRIFVNLPGSKDVAVVDRLNNKVLTKWGTGVDLSNFPMALDEKANRLFIVCRLPARLLVLDTSSGRIVTKLDTVGDSDDLFYDAARHRVYVTGGEGAIAVYDQTDPDHYKQTARIATAPGARTSLFVPETGQLFVAVPHRDQQRSEVRVYKTN